MEIILDRKDWNNAAAFISMDSESGNVHVYGKFYVEEGCRRRSYGGPTTGVLDTVPAHLLEEAKSLSWNMPRSQELDAFCDKVFAKAKKEEAWFSY
jgi:hypothetical protein